MKNVADGRWQVVALHPGSPSKPALGAPCNGCGLCCLAEPCPLGVVVSRKRRGACNALEWDAAAGRYACGMVVAPSSHVRPRWLGRLAAPLLARLARRWIAAGIGCDADITLPAGDDDQGSIVGRPD